MERYAASNRCVVRHAASREVAQKLHGGLKDTNFILFVVRTNKFWFEQE
jgi:hypothetical protein